jgi:RNase adapter protein RapZ
MSDGKKNNFILVTGPSGAGRSTAINAFEDLGYETINNLPLALLPRLLSGPSVDLPIALGIDVRTRDFSHDGVLKALARISHNAEYKGALLFLDCDTDTLIRRYSETRRRHPMAPDASPQLGIARERDLLARLQDRADVMIDTTDLTPHDLRGEIARWFVHGTGGALAIVVQSFSYKRGTPIGIDMVLDCRFLRNPHWDVELRSQTGLQAPVQDYIRKDARFAPFFEKITDMTGFLLPAYQEEGKSHFSIGLGCTGGQHRSVFVAEELAKALAIAGWQVSIRHRELDRRDRA